jgi:signal recognition particle GTPase
MKSDSWVSSSALLTRMNFALALTAGKVRGVTVDAAQLAGGPPLPPDPDTTLSTMEAKLLASDVSRQTHDSIVAQLASPASSAKKGSPQPSAAGAKPSKQDANRPQDASTIAGLLLGSPEFQRR